MDKYLEDFDRTFMDMYGGVNGGVDYVYWKAFLTQLSNVDTEQAEELRAAIRLVSRAQQAVKREALG